MSLSFLRSHHERRHTHLPFSPPIEKEEKNQVLAHQSQFEEQIKNLQFQMDGKVS